MGDLIRGWLLEPDSRGNRTKFHLPNWEVRFLSQANVHTHPSFRSNCSMVVKPGLPRKNTPRRIPSVFERAEESHLAERGSVCPGGFCLSLQWNPRPTGLGRWHKPVTEKGKIHDVWYSDPLA